MKHVNIPIFIPHVGCPFTCIFCNQRHIASQLEPLSPSAIPELVDQHLATIPPGSEIEIAFFGGSFTMMDVSLQEAYLRQVSPYLIKGLIHGLRLSTRPDGIDPDILKMLKYWGVDTVELGVQSCDDEVLAAAGRGMALLQIVGASRLLKEYGFKLGIQLMVGLPGDNRLKDLATTRVIIGLRPDMVRIYPTLVIAGTELARQWREGSYQELSLPEAVSVCAEMLLMFQYHHIPVIRLGLQPSQELQSAETLLAGPYHPAFGELVEQHIFYMQARELLLDAQALPGRDRPVNLLVNPADVSRLIGQHRRNFLRLEEELGTGLLKVIKSEAIASDSLGLYYSGENRILTLVREDFIRRLIDRGLLPGED
jgi:histone acetyltransferase (RNA polymerase elongator complex component)